MADFSPNELEVMKVLWEHGELKPGQIQDLLPRPIKNSTVRWQLGELVEEGHVGRRQVGKAFLYRALTPRKRAFKHITERLVDVFSGGSALAFIGELIESKKLSPEDLHELQELAARSKPGGTKRKGDTEP